MYLSDSGKMIATSKGQTISIYKKNKEKTKFFDTKTPFIQQKLEVDYIVAWEFINDGSALGILTKGALKVYEICQIDNVLEPLFTISTNVGYFQSFAVSNRMETIITTNTEETVEIWKIDDVSKEYRVY